MTKEIARDLKQTVHFPSKIPFVFLLCSRYIAHIQMFKRISEKSVTFAKQLSENKQIFQSIFTKTAAPPSLPPSYNYSRMISSSSHCSTLRSRAGEQASYIVHHHHLNGGLFPVRLFSSAAAAAAAPVLSLRDLHSSSFTTPHFPLRLGPLHQYAARKPRFVSTTASSNEQPVSSPRNKDDIEEEHQPPFLAPPRPRSSPGVKQAREMHAVNVAVAVNIAIFFAKVATWSVTRSGALLAEALHSFADIANQLLLRAGVEQSRRPATRQHPYGFHREKYIYALMSAVGVFCLGAGASVIHGIQSLLDPPALQNMGYSLAVLSLSSLAEMYSLRVAYSAVRIGAKEQGQAILPYLMSSNDPTTAAVLAEDAGAVAGLGIAGVASYMTYVTGDPLYDALGSIAVGCLMGAVAVTLIRNNKKFLIGQAMRPEMHAAIVAHLGKLIYAYLFSLSFPAFGCIRECTLLPPINSNDFERLFSTVYHTNYFLLFQFDRC